MVGDWIKRRHLDSGSSVTIELGEEAITFPVPADSSPAEIEALTDRFVALLKKHSGAS